MLHFEGAKDIAQPVNFVWGKLSDARFLVACIPGVESVHSVDEKSAACTLRPGFAFVRGTLDLSVTVTSAVPDQSIHLLLQTKGIGSSSDVEADLNLSPQGNGTRLQWGADIKSLGGLLKAVPQGLIKAAAQKVISDALAAVEAKLASGSGT